MFSTEGLSHGEVIVLSGIFAVVLLSIASVIGVVIAHLATRTWSQAPALVPKVAMPRAEEVRPVALPTTA
ncbi:MAG TPA: hypothetical protein VLM40_02205 [Gemmata sp.]|nr:hypothetical protein [Gemmata sp.]